MTAVIRRALPSAILVIALSALLAEDSKQKKGSASEPKIEDLLHLQQTIQSIQVDAQLDAQNPSAVTIVVDLTKLSPLKGIYFLIVPVQFLDSKGKLIATEKYEFTDTAIPVLWGGQKYKRTFEHGVKMFNVANGKLKTLPAQGMIGSDMQVSKQPSLQIQKLIEKLLGPGDST